MFASYRSLNEYERIDKIGEGSYGVVTCVRNKRTTEKVAMKELKMLDAKDGFPLTALREINILASLCHPSIVRFKEVVMEENVSQDIRNMKVFLVMEYVEYNLHDFMHTTKHPFRLDEVKSIMFQLIDVVRYMHNNWIIHRDLKSTNILLNKRHEVKVYDFGMAREYGSRPLRHTEEVVTLKYRAPELLSVQKSTLFQLTCGLWVASWQSFLDKSHCFQENRGVIKLI